MSWEHIDEYIDEYIDKYIDEFYINYYKIEEYKIDYIKKIFLQLCKRYSRMER